MRTYDAFIDGKFVRSTSSSVIRVINPATDEVVGEVPSCSVEDTKKAIEAAKRAQKEWRKLPAIQRAAYLRNLAAEVRNNADLLGRIVTEEQGKPLSNAIGEVKEAADLMDYHAEWARRIEGEIIQSDSPDENVFLYKEPLGVVACVLPWNFPFYVLVRKLAPALITGNTVILKPSSETPLSALEFAKISQQVGIPAGVINAVTGKGSTVGRELCENSGVNMVTFTGSVEVGQEIMRACATSVAKVSLELGGKAPAIVMDDADLDLAVNCIVASRISNAGQVCTCTERVYVQEGIADRFTEKVVAAMKSVEFGDGLANPNIRMGPMINHAAVESVHAMVLRAVKDGAKILTGGKIPSKPEKGSFYEPTVLGGCRQDMEIVREETFGPVMPILTFKTVDEAIDLANDCKYGLASALYTSSLKTAMKVANNIEFGELYVNRKQGEAFNGYHAGWKQSGIGGDDGKHGLEEFLHTRVVYVKF